MDGRFRQALVLEDGRTILYHRGNGLYAFRPAPAPQGKRGGAFDSLGSVFVAAEGARTSGRDVEYYLKALHKHNTGLPLRKDREWCLSFVASKGIGGASEGRLYGVRIDTSAMVPHDPGFVASFVSERVDEGDAHLLVSDKHTLSRGFRRAWRSSGRGVCLQTADEILAAVDAVIRSLGVQTRRSGPLPGCGRQVVAGAAS